MSWKKIAFELVWLIENGFRLTERAFLFFSIFDCDVKKNISGSLTFNKESEIRPEKNWHINGFGQRLLLFSNVRFHTLIKCLQASAHFLLFSLLFTRTEKSPHFFHFCFMHFAHFHLNMYHLVERLWKYESVRHWWLSYENDDIFFLSMHATLGSGSFCFDPWIERLNDLTCWLTPLFSLFSLHVPVKPNESEREKKHPRQNPIQFTQ